MTANLRQRQVLARLATAPTAEQRAAMARDFAQRHAHNAVARFELERAARIDAQLQADLLLKRIRAAGEIGCAAPAEREPAAETLRTIALRMLAITVMLAFGWLLREPVARALVWLGVLS